MSASLDRTVGRLLWCYPKSWRARYGAELATLIADMSEDRPVAWRLRVNVAASGVRERLVSAFGGRQQNPEAGMLGGTLLVLWAWALFVLGGSIVTKTSEHWSDAVPGGASSVSTTAFDLLTDGAIGAAVLVLTGVGWGLPRFLAFLRAGGWPQIRRPVLVALAVSVLTVGATVGLVMLASAVDEGHHVAASLSRAAFLGWAGLGAACVRPGTGGGNGAHGARDRGRRRGRPARAHGASGRVRTVAVGG